MEFVKCCLTFCAPDEIRCSFDEAMERFGIVGEVLYEAPIVAGNSEELLHGFHSVGPWLGSYQ